MTLRGHASRDEGITRMMGHSHALTGAALGLAVADELAALRHPLPPLGVVILAVMAAGAALVPDLDHPGATATRAFGPVSRLLGEALVDASHATYRLTRTRYDPVDRGAHRTLTHTLPFAAAAGALTYAVTRVPSPWAALAVLLVGASLAASGVLAHWTHRAGWLVTNAAAAGFAAFVAVTPSPTGPPWELALGVFAGCVAHDLGDALTTAGVPLLWPLAVRGQRWRCVGVWRVARFHTGGAVELRLVVPLAWAAAGVAAVEPWLTR